MVIYVTMLACGSKNKGDVSWSINLRVQILFSRKKTNADVSVKGNYMGSHTALEFKL